MASLTRKQLVLYASEIAIITGDNSYQKLSDFVIKLWQKYDNNDFNNCLETLQPHHSVKFVQTNDLENINNIEKKCGINVQSEMKNILKNSKNAEEVVQKKNQLLKKVESQVTDKNLKKELEKSVTNVVNTSYGIKNEDNVLQVYSKNKQITVHKVCEFRKRKIGNNLYIGGKIDGLTQNGEIVEIKNRMYKLFNNLREYERIQLQCYIYIFKLKKGYLVENFKDKINIIEELYDKKYMDSLIYRLIRFEIFFDDFMNNIDLKTLLLFGEDKLKENTLKTIFKKYKIIFDKK